MTPQVAVWYCFAVMRLTTAQHLRWLGGLVAGAAIAAHADLAPAEPQAQPKVSWPPIVFYVAKGDPDECGPGCREWIVAEGLIDREAPQRLRALLGRLGQRKLPIYFHSPGGSVEAGLAIGRLLRERHLTAGVARTIPLGCDPTKEHDDACDIVKRSGKELVAEFRTARTLCNSSCVYALIGAAVREVAAGARIGVHEMAVGKYDERGAPVSLDRKTLSREQMNQLRAEEVRLERYIGEMGIDRALFDAAAQIGNERIRYLSLDEIARFGIDRREFQESKWMVDEGPPGPLTVLKFVVEAKEREKGADKGGEKGGEPKPFRLTRIRLRCDRAGDIRVEFSRELASSDRPASIAVSTRNDAFVLAPPRAKPMVGYNDVVIEDRLARVPLAFFEDAAAGEAIEVKQAPASAMPDKAAPPTRLSTLGLAAAMRTLAPRCRRP
jgi:hypothetical protein